MSRCRLVAGCCRDPRPPRAPPCHPTHQHQVRSTLLRWSAYWSPNDLVWPSYLLQLPPHPGNDAFFPSFSSSYHSLLAFHPVYICIHIRKPFYSSLSLSLPLSLSILFSLTAGLDLRMRLFLSFLPLLESGMHSMQEAERPTKMHILRADCVCALNFSLSLPISLSVYVCMFRTCYYYYYYTL